MLLIHILRTFHGAVAQSVERPSKGPARLVRCNYTEEGSNPGRALNGRKILAAPSGEVHGLEHG